MAAFTIAWKKLRDPKTGWRFWEEADRVVYLTDAGCQVYDAGGTEPGVNVSDAAFVNAYLNPAFESKVAIARALGLNKSSVTRRAEALGLPPREELLSGQTELPVALRAAWLLVVPLGFTYWLLGSRRLLAPALAVAPSPGGFASPTDAKPGDPLRVTTPAVSRRPPLGDTLCGRSHRGVTPRRNIDARPCFAPAFPPE